MAAIQEPLNYRIFSITSNSNNTGYVVDGQSLTVNKELPSKTQVYSFSMNGDKLDKSFKHIEVNLPRINLLGIYLAPPYLCTFSNDIENKCIDFEQAKIDSLVISPSNKDEKLSKLPNLPLSTIVFDSEKKFGMQIGGESILDSDEQKYIYKFQIDDKSKNKVKLVDKLKSDITLIGHTSDLVAGKIMIIGGKDNDNVFVLDGFQAKTLKKVTLTGDKLPKNLHLHSTIVLDHKIFIVGGTSDGKAPNNNIYLLDTDSMTVKDMGKAEGIVSRFSHTILQLQDQYVLMGGYNVVEDKLQQVLDAQHFVISDKDANPSLRVKQNLTMNHLSNDLIFKVAVTDVVTSTSPGSTSNAVIIGGSVGGFVLLLILVAFIYFARRTKSLKAQKSASLADRNANSKGVRNHPKYTNYSKDSVTSNTNLVSTSNSSIYNRGESQHLELKEKHHHNRRVSMFSIMEAEQDTSNGNITENDSIVLTNSDSVKNISPLATKQVF